MLNYNDNNEVYQMLETIKNRNIQYINDFVVYCLNSNPKWYEMVVDNRSVQYKIIMFLDDLRGDNDNMDDDTPLNVSAV